MGSPSHFSSLGPKIYIISVLKNHFFCIRTSISVYYSLSYENQCCFSEIRHIDIRYIVWEFNLNKPHVTEYNRKKSF